MPRGWRPSFLDYPFPAFSTATAFSPTDVVPLTSRAKMMMLENSISLITDRRRGGARYQCSPQLS
jgi:hypothetical protein